MKILATLGFNRTALREDRIINRRADIVWPPEAVIWHRWTIICKVPSEISVTETIDALKNNIREAIGEI